MAFLISQDDDSEFHNTTTFHPYPLKRLLTSLGIFQSHSHHTTTTHQLSVHRLLDINHKYKFRLSIKAYKQNLYLSTCLFKHSELFTIGDMPTRVVYYRLVQKYYGRGQLTVYLTTGGGFVTKKAVGYESLDVGLGCSLRRDNANGVNPQRDNCELVKSTLFEFIQQSASFYKSLIHKLQGNVNEISRLRPNYPKRQYLAVNLCNRSCYPTLEMYRKEIQATSQMVNLQERYKGKRVQGRGQLVRLICHHQALYSPFLSPINPNPNPCSLGNSFTTQPHFHLNLQQIYNKLLQRHERTLDRYVLSELSNSQKQQKKDQMDLLYKTLVGNLDAAVAKREAKENRIYNSVHVVNSESVRWENFQCTALSELKIGKIKYVYADEQQPINRSKQPIPQQQFHMPEPYQATVILKHQPQKLLPNNTKPSYTSQQLKWQKAIIEQCFKTSHCIYMTRFFSPLQPSKLFTHPRSTTYILSQYIRRGTLQKWLYQSGSCMNSIFTKMNVILYILYGVMFMHSKKVFHMDIKPQNILIDKNLVPKIADFGSAYNKQVHQKMRKQKIHYYLSFSIPYTAPQIFMSTHKPQINAKCDVFSLGLIIYEIFFNRTIFGQVSSDRLDRMYRQIGGKMDEWEERKLKSRGKELGDVPQELVLRGIFLCPQASQMQRQSAVYHLLMNLVMRCLSCNQEKRPNVGMLVIAIRQIFQMTVQYYAW